MDTLLIPISSREAQFIKGAITVVAIGGSFALNYLIHRIYEYVVNNSIKIEIVGDPSEIKSSKECKNKKGLFDYIKIGATLAGGAIVAKYVSKHFIEYGNSVGIFFAMPILPFGLSNRIIKILKPNASIT